MKLWRLFALLTLPGLVFLACGTDEDEEEGYTAPFGLAVSSYHAAGGMVTLTWSASSGSFSGYRVYAHETTIASEDTDEIGDYLEATLGTGTTQYNLALPSTDYYYVHVRAFTEDSDKASNEIYIIARPEGTGTLYEFDSPAPNASGFDLSTGEEVSMAVTNAERHTKVDFWVGYAAATQYTGDEDLYFWNPKDASPDYRNTTSFRLLGTAAFESYESVEVSGNWISSVAVTPNTVYAVEVVDQTGLTHYGKIVAQSDPTGTYPDRTVSIRWAYQPEDNLPWFGPGQ